MAILYIRQSIVYLSITNLKLVHITIFTYELSVKFEALFINNIFLYYITGIHIEK